MLKNTFFSPFPLADLRDIPRSFYSTLPLCHIIITKLEVLGALQLLSSNKAPGPYSISNKILKSCAIMLAELLAPLYQACIDQVYHPQAFKIANTITIKKPGKKATDYVSPKGYCSITLLNTLSKVMESIMGKKISYLAKTYHLLPETQMRARRGKSTETALQLLLEQIHTVWGQGNDKVAILLSMDVANAFNTVSHQQLIHNLRRKKIPKWVTNWVNSVLEDQSTTLAIFQIMTEQFTVRTGIPQGSPLSPILYLFYNANLLKIYNQPGINTGTLRFVDDVNILAYRKSTEDNCKTLEKIHQKCKK